jgi:sulfotransferase family protein
MVGQHPEMYALPEVNLLAGETYRHITRLYGMRRCFQDGLLRAIAELGLGAQTFKTIALAHAWLQENSGVSTSSLFAKLSDWVAPKTMVDGSRIYCLHSVCLPRLQYAFPEARYLHLLRHPKSVLDSMQKVLPRQPFGADMLWLRPHLEIMEFLEEIPPERQVRLRVEDLLYSPDLYLKQIAEWLEISRDTASIESMKHPELSPFASYGPVNARYGNDSDFLENPALRTTPKRPQPPEIPSPSDTGLAFTEETQKYASLFGYFVHG